MFYIIIIFFVGLDQIIKMIIDSNFYPGQSIPVIKDFFHLTYVRNSGAGFGILSGQRIFLIIITLIILILLIIYRYKNKENILLNIGISFIVAGAIGNLVDRLRLSFVIDYLDFRIWPVFNLADIIVNIGVGLLILYIWKYEGDKIEGK